MYSIIGVDGNAFAVMGYVMQAMRTCGKTRAEIENYRKAAMRSTYNNLIVVSEEMCRSLNELTKQ